MHQRDLATFLRVAEAGSVTLAAEMLGRSQPSVSRCLQDLEASLGFSLFERAGRRISLTAEGVAFEEEARRLLALFEDLPARTLARAKGTARPMSISATYALGTGLVPHALARWPEADRPKEIRLMQAAPNAVAQDLLSGNARIGLASLPLDVPGVNAERLFRAPLVAALPEARTDEFPEGVAVSLAQVASDTVVTMLDQTRLQGRIRQALDAANVHPARAIRANSSVSALQFVRLTGATAIVEPITAYGTAPRGVILRPLVETVDFTFGFFAAEGAATARDTQDFFDLCEETLFALVPQVRPLDGSPHSKIRD
ncbi:LysR family transcriptional regulator [Pseudooceanicola sp. CBS1P-1]|uniref:LysR family transcriptional regulator n=1 Tax=Pseudooceanicola albus TaxID=2692189 RepID=A0A6L7G931_9RHOB|nr:MULTISPECIES: LysR family transcriptional regulator [Pseudooceanicola]MBT9384366.1 LysR family transcriptional regulator [Pseudooceanicola endophyticus]MXN19896.1 LysR family transcriptional regulator [Pseudooceanicola albus]